MYVNLKDIDVLTKSMKGNVDVDVNKEFNLSSFD